MRIVGWAPTVMCRSEARRSTTSVSSAAKSMFIAWRIGRRAGPFAIVRSRLDERSTPSGGAHDARDLGDRGAPVLDLLQAVLAQRAHPLLDGELADLVGRPALE